MNTIRRTYQQDKPAGQKGLTVYEMTVFSMFGALMYASKVAMQALPNIHLLGMFVMLLTIVYRQKALIPIYLYVMLEGLFGGFSLWWIPYLYLWAILWGITMLLPKKLPHRVALIVYPVVCALFGLAFGTLYAPAQALLFGLDFHGMIAWILAGLPYDFLHCAGNFAAGFLVLPLSKVLQKNNAHTTR